MFDYPVILTKEENGTVTALFPDVPEALTFGEDKEEARLNAIDALETGLSFYIEARKPLPQPSRAKRGQETVSPGPLECAKLGLYQAMTEQGIKKSELARRLGWHLPQTDRLFDLRHASKLEQIIAAARVLGKHLHISLS